MRGVVMNPVDHPHGGGEGKAGAGNPHPVSPWGQPTKALKPVSQEIKVQDISLLEERRSLDRLGGGDAKVSS